MTVITPSRQKNEPRSKARRHANGAAQGDDGEDLHVVETPHLSRQKADEGDHKDVVVDASPKPEKLLGFC